MNKNQILIEKLTEWQAQHLAQTMRIYGANTLIINTGITSEPRRYSLQSAGDSTPIHNALIAGFIEGRYTK